MINASRTRRGISGAIVIVLVSLTIPNPMNAQSATAGNNTGQGSSSAQSQAQSSTQNQGQSTGNGSAAPSTQTFFESQMLTYGALDEIASVVASRVCSASGPTSHLILFDTASFAAVQQFHRLKRNIDVLAALFRSFANKELEAEQIKPLVEHALNDVENIGPGLAAGESIFQTLSGSMSATTVDKNTTFPLSDTAIAMDIAQQLHERHDNSCNMDVTYPKFGLAEESTEVANAEEKLTHALADLFRIQRIAAGVAQQAEEAAKAEDRGATNTSASATQSAGLGTMFGSPLRVVIKDAAGNPLSGVVVTFTAPATGPSGTFEGDGTSVKRTTGRDGVASVRFIANSQAGTYAVVASAPGLAPTVAFSLTNTTAPPASISVAGSPANAAATSTPAALPRSITGSDYLSLTGATGLLNQVLLSYAQANSTTGNNALSTVLYGARILKLLQQPHTYVLFWEGTAAGGTQRDRKNLFTNLFTGDLLRYSGGAVLSYGLINSATGAIIAPGVLRLMEPYTTIRNPEKCLRKSIRRASNW